MAPLDTVVDTALPPADTVSVPPDSRVPPISAPLDVTLSIAQLAMVVEDAVPLDRTTTLTPAGMLKPIRA